MRCEPNTTYGWCLFIFGKSSLLLGMFNQQFLHMQTLATSHRVHVEFGTIRRISLIAKV